ncbi:MAG: biopolymer transporter ExbD, partial [Rhodothermales bacterium]|nr:biopolymer transporter ExbD [Rhodothermales bacterium]
RTLMPLDFSSGRKPLSVFSLAGLTDIVLLLLIFFLLTSSFVAQHGIQVALPQVEAAVPEEDATLTVTLTAEGVYYVDGVETVEAALGAAVAEAAPGKAALVLRADQDATVGQFATVAGAARAAGLRILMATEPGRERR